MTDLKSIRKFEYRPCRISTGFDVEFVVGGETFTGLCRDVSDTGIRVELDGSVIVGDTGVLVLRHPAGPLKLEAQVSYIDKSHVGLVFVFNTTRDCAIAIEYMAAITNYAAASMVVEFP